MKLSFYTSYIISNNNSNIVNDNIKVILSDKNNNLIGDISFLLKNENITGKFYAPCSTFNSKSWDNNGIFKCQAKVKLNIGNLLRKCTIKYN